MQEHWTGESERGYQVLSLGRSADNKKRQRNPDGNCPSPCPSPHAYMGRGECGGVALLIIYSLSVEDVLRPFFDS